MLRNRPPSEQTQLVLFALAEVPTTWRHGYELCQHTRLKAGTLYPILIRLADRGWLETQWETDMPAGRPPRHLYRLTELGRKQVKELATAKLQPAKVRPTRVRPRTGEA